MNSKRVIVCLGSNIEPRHAHLARARAALAALPRTRLVTSGAIAETDPVDVPAAFAGQKFLNQIVVLETRLLPFDFARRMHAVEDALGRVRGPVRNTPRTIDIDLIDYEDVMMDTPELILPHPRARERAFVMEPLRAMGLSLTEITPRYGDRERPESSPVPDVEILFEDGDILVVNKPAGVLVHPAPGCETGTLTDALVRVCPSLAGVGSAERPGVVHRLDRDTSGVMVFAKTPDAYRALRAAFESHTAVEKTYLAVTHGAPRAKTGRLETLLARRADKKRMRVVEPPMRGQRAVTRWTVLARHGAQALVEFVIETGRMHQIRVHAAHLGCPLAGDTLYGDPVKDRRMASPPRRQLLHAVQLSFPHPRTGKTVTFAAEPPPDILFAR